MLTRLVITENAFSSGFSNNQLFWSKQRQSMLKTSQVFLFLMENSILKISGSMDVKINLTSVLNKVIWFSADKWKDASFAFSSNASNAAQGVKLHHFGDALSLMDPIVSLLCNCNYYYIICKLRPSIFLTIVLSYDRNRDVLLA